MIRNISYNNQNSATSQGMFVLPLNVSSWNLEFSKTLHL